MVKWTYNKFKNKNNTYHRNNSSFTSDKSNLSRIINNDSSDVINGIINYLLSFDISFIPSTCNIKNQILDNNRNTLSSRSFTILENLLNKISEVNNVVNTIN